MSWRPFITLIKDLTFYRSKLQMNRGVEAAAIAAWIATFHASKQTLDRTSLLPDAQKTVFAGALSGLAVAAISLPYGSRQFPELRIDLDANPLRAPFRNTAKLAIGHALFWTLYQGLSLPVHRKPSGMWGSADFATLFFASAVSGIGYRCVAYAFYSGPLANPAGNPRAVLTSCLAIASITTASEYCLHSISDAPH